MMKQLRHYECTTLFDLCSFSYLILQAKSEEQLASERAFLEAERVWLVHKDGFAGAGLLSNKDDGVAPSEEEEGRVRVQLDYNGDVIEVEEDDVERANPPALDKCEDLAQLRYSIISFLKN